MAKKLATAADVKAMVPNVTKVRITNRVNGHPFSIGEVLTFRCSGGPTATYIHVVEDNAGYRIYNNEYEIIQQSRADQAESLETEIETMEKKITEMRAEAARLRKYKDDNDELAHLISETIKSDGSPESIYTLLTKFNISK